jgi:DNA-binding HxlR family transcriptional regulator
VSSNQEVTSKPQIVDCSIEKALSIIGGKWSFLVLRELFCGTKRFGELKRSIRGISSKSLTETLRHLENNEIIYRQAYSTIPPTVEYTLTKKGQSLHKIIHDMKEWGAEWG